MQARHFFSITSLAAVAALAACDGNVGPTAPVVQDEAFDNGSNDNYDEAGLVDYDPSYPNLVDGYVLARLERLGIEPHWAEESELIRRMSLDLSGAVPDAADYTAMAGASPTQMAQYFIGKPGWTMVSQVIMADMLAFSNDPMYSTQAQISALNDSVAQLYNGTLAYDDFARQTILSDAYLSRFTSAADRATATQVIFIGYEPVTQFDFQFGNMFRGYACGDASDACLPDNQGMECDPCQVDRIYTWTGICDDPETEDEVESCQANMWGQTGNTPEEAVAMITSLPAFAEHGATMVWKRFIGEEIDMALPELTVALGEFFAQEGYNMTTMTMEIVTSAAYTQSFTYRNVETAQ